MKRLLIMFIIAGAFLGGYYLGLRPGSPDVFHWAGERFQGLEDLSKIVSEAQAARCGQEPNEQPDEGPPSEITTDGVLVYVDGQPCIVRNDAECGVER